MNRLAAIHIAPLHLQDGTIVAPSTNVRNFGAIFESEMTMSDHVNSVTCTCFYQLSQLSFVRHSLSAYLVGMLVQAFVSSRVDYCNSPLYGAGAHVTCKLQVELNAATRLITGVGRYDHRMPVLRDMLHWLPVKQCMIYKIALLAYKCLLSTGPAYLKDYCIRLITEDLQHHLRSVARGDITHSATRTRHLGPRSFGSSSSTV